MDTSEIILACQQLVREGKSPSVALVKSRLTRNYPLPTIIAGLKQWQANPELNIEPAKPIDSENDSEVTLEQRVAELEAQVRELTAQLKSIKNEEV
jgi:hypothetical protein